MARTFALTCGKAFLVLYNFVFLVSGAVVLACGIWLHVDVSLISLLKLLERAEHGPHVTMMAAVLMGVGASVLLLSFLGCCGACCESMCMLCCYTCLLVLILVTQATAGILIALSRHKILQLLQTALYTQVRNQYNRTFNNTDFFTKAWDRVQVDMECCGARGPHDFRYSAWFNASQENGNFVPATCCYMSNSNPNYPMVINDNQCQIDAILYPDQISASYSLKTNGCLEQMTDWVSRSSSIFITLAVVLTTVQILGLLITCVLMTSIKREQTKYPWYVDDDEEE